MKRLSRKQKFWSVLGAGLLVAAVSGSALARAGEDRGVLHVETQKEHTSATSTLPLRAPEPQSEIEFTGAVEVMASDTWVIGGRTVTVTADTEIATGLTIGAMAEVHALHQADGSLLALEIAPAEAGNTDEVNSSTNSDDTLDENNTGNSNENSSVNSDEDLGNSNEHDSNVNSDDSQSNDNHGDGVNSDSGNVTDDHNSNVTSNQHDSNDDNGGSSD